MSGNVGSGTGTGGGGKKDPALRSPVQPGDLVADKYRVEEILAAGGMGVVVAARHEQLGQRYAVKFLLRDAKHADAVERFLREARAAARIDSSHVCRVFDCGTLPDGTPYMVMELLAGHDLSQELKSRGKLPVAEAADLMLQALEGIAEAHAVGIVHRDLKPSNLFLSQRAGRPREVKVLDFGISKLAPGGGLEQAVDDDLTATAAMLGSPRYMSPEQVQNAKTVDSRTDIWSLGVILYQMLDGRSPFAGTTMGETIGKVLLHVPPPLRDSRSDVPEGLALVLDRCLQRDREKRYRNVAELALALAPFASPASQASVQRVTALLVEGHLAAATPGAASDSLVQATVVTGPLAARSREDEPSHGTVGAFTQSMPARPRRRYLVAGLGALALVAVAAVALALAMKRSEPALATSGSAALGSTRGNAAATPSVSVRAASAEPSAAAAEPSAAVPEPSAASPESSAATAQPRASAPGPQPSKPKPAKLGGRPAKGGDDILNESY